MTAAWALVLVGFIAGLWTRHLFPIIWRKKVAQNRPEDVGLKWFKGPELAEILQEYNRRQEVELDRTLVLRRRIEGEAREKDGKFSGERGAL
ncbi:hypothetical protein LCGC14_1789310 [marine sediment metagenome]|uniref:Uncharacterized protein n=1 Tax=marine sediment metagenome TaxID=412755 RepID=A0A0F9GT25_9ZZZZ